MKKGKLVRDILVITLAYPPGGRVGERRTLRFVRNLPGFGWRPVVLAGPEGPVRFDRNAALKGCEGVAEYRARIFGPLELARGAKALLKGGGVGGGKPNAHSGRRGRAPGGSAGDSGPAGWKTALKKWMAVPDEQCGWIPFAFAKGLRIVRRERVRVLYTNGPPHSCHVVGAMLAWATGLPWVMDLRDPWSRKPWLPEAERGSLRHKLICQLERRCVRRAFRVVLNTPRMRDEFRAFYRDEPPEKFVCIPNACDPVEIPANSPANGVFTLAHTGALYKRRNPEGLLRAVAMLRDRGEIGPDTFALYLVGPLSDYFRVPELLGRLGLEGMVRLVPPVEHRESLRYLARSHVLVLIQPDTDLQVPAKVFEYMLFHKPILALTGEGALKDLMESFNLGPVADPRDPEGIAKALEGFVREYREKGGVSRNYAEAVGHFDPMRLTGELAALFDAAVGQGRG